jgi:hypothetical protein
VHPSVYTGLGTIQQELSNSIDEDFDIIGIFLRRIYDFDPLVKIFAPFLKGNNSQVPLEKYKSFDSVTYFVTAYFNTSLVLRFTFLAPNRFLVKTF